MYGKQLMQAVVLILESEHTPDVKEQALCILSNIADGDSAKRLIVDNEDMLKKLTSYMLHSNSKLQIAAVVCILNLIWRNDDGSADRQIRLKEIGVFKILHQLLTTTDTNLFEKVKLALQQLTMWQVVDDSLGDGDGDGNGDDHDHHGEEDKEEGLTLQGDKIDFMFF